MVSRIEILKRKKLKNPVLITGLPGIGLVGKISVDYLLKQFKAEKIANVYSDSFPPSVQIMNGLLDLIRDEIYCWEFKGRHFLFLAGPIQPSLDFHSGSAFGHYEFASAIVQAAKKFGVKEIVTLAGINVGDERMEREPAVIVAATNQEMLKKFKKLGAKVNKSNGLIAGAAGLILGIGRKQGLQGACLMGETNAKLIYGDHGAAKKVVELLVKAYGFRVKMAGIKKEAKNIENAFAQLSKQFEEKREEFIEEKPSYVR